MYTPINKWSEDDRPREKFLIKGQAALSDSELLAILIGSGSKNESALQLCQKILSFANNNLNQLGKLSIKQLTDFKGIGEAKAVTIAAALELGRRRRSEESIELQKITSSKEAFEIMQPIIGDLQHEEFWVLFLNHANKVIYKSQISKGGLISISIDIRVIFKLVFEHNATSIVLAHNHPSGKLIPSQEDIELTNKIKIAASPLQILVLDHLIVSETNYYSFKDAGTL